MIEFRWLQKVGRPLLQSRQLFEPQMIASGDIVLRVAINPQWADVPTAGFQDFHPSSEGNNALENDV